MIRTKRKQSGFSILVIVVVVLVIGAMAAIGLLVYQRYKPTASSNTPQTSYQQKSTTYTQAQADPYAGWKTYCDMTVKACIKYPPDWVQAQYGGLENPACTAFATLTGPTVKDQGSGTAYVASIDDLSTPIPDLKVLGLVINNEPSYSVYNASYLSSINVTVGATQEIGYINYRFTGKTGNAGLVGTTCANGGAAITTFDQAKAWFSTTEGKTVLKVVESIYYQP